MTLENMSFIVTGAASGPAAAVARQVVGAWARVSMPELDGQALRARAAAPGASQPPPARLGDPGAFAAQVAHVFDTQMLNRAVIRRDAALRMAAG